MRDGGNLSGLALAVAERGTVTVRALAPDHVHRVPELRRAHDVRHVPQLADDLPTADLVAELRAELAVVPLLIDGVRAAAVHQNALVGCRDDVVERDVSLAGQQRDVGHALKLDAAPAVRMAVAMRARQLVLLRVPPLERGGELARRLIIHEDAVPDDQVVLRTYAVVVVAVRGAAAFLRPVTLDVH